MNEHKIKEIIEDAKDRFGELLKDYVFEDDSKLTSGAIRYKKELIKFCEDNLCYYNILEGE